MAMMREQRENENMRQRMDVIESERRRVEELADSLSQQATIEWRKAIEGFVALPAAITVGVAASTLYLVGFVTRGLEIFQAQSLEARRRRELDGGEAGREREEEGRQERGREERGRGDMGRPEMPTA